MTNNNDIYNEPPPALPPRSNNAFRTVSVLKEKLDLNNAFIPSALFFKYQDANVDHVHVFRQYQVMSTQQEVVSNNEIDIDNNSNNKENQPQTTLKTFKFICQRCHISLFINTTCPEKDGCNGNQYPTHHYHPILNNNVTNNNEANNNNKTDIFSCCGCGKEVHMCLKEPVVSLDTFDFLADTRPLTLNNTPDQSIPLKPTVKSTVLTFKSYIKNQIDGNNRNINIRNRNFTDKIGLDFASTQILEAAGFRLEGEYFLVPETINKERLQIIYEQLSVKQFEIESTLNQGIDNNLWDNSILIDTILKDILGCQYQVEKITAVYKAELIPYCLKLGVTNLSSIELIIWAFHRMLLEQPENKTELVKTLSHIAEIMDDELLRTEVAIAISHGSIDSMDVDDVQQQLDNNNNNNNGYFSSQGNSYLDAPFGGNYLSNTKRKLDNQENQVVLREPTPVGLNNIGNTCYLNSLLQYYFTLVPFRNTILNMDDYVENEDKLGWQPKKLGGIEVDQQEVKRAKTFVRLLKGLFIQLQQTHKNAISPEYDLAFMALLNEKENPENEKDNQSNNNNNNNNNSNNNNRESTSSSTKDGTCSELLGSVSTLVDSKRGSDEERTSEQESVGVGYIIEENELPPAYNEIATNDEKVLLGGNSDPLIDNKTSLNVINDSSTLDSQYNLPTPSTSTSTLDKNESSQQQEQPSTSTLSLPKKKKIPENMMFGKQQDVTECMGNVMYLVEAALKPEETENMEQTRDMVKTLFYGKARQILSYKDTETTDTVQKMKEEEFSHVIVDAAEGKSLYDGLDEYFFAEQVENFRGGKEVIREVSVREFPPILQILIQRVQFDRTLGNVYKSNAFIQFDEVIYLDRYIDQNFEKLASRRSKVAEWNIQLKECKKVIKNLTKNKDYPMPVSDMLEATATILQEYSNGGENNEYNDALELLKNEAEQARNIVNTNNEIISDLQSKIKHEYDDLKECAYRLHAVFIHQGQASYGHYWLYIYDHEESVWWKFNDSTVSKVSSTNIFNDTTGSTANPYFLVYVRNDVDNLVQTVFKSPPTPSETAEDKLSNV
ncbi:unnamed protein product [Cunninghamella blakesleeana]